MLDQEKEGDDVFATSPSLQRGVDAEERLQKMQGAFKTILECMGEDPTREGLIRTPMRAAKAMLFFTKGYEDSLQTAVSHGVFHVNHDDMVIVKGINMFSLCEHHLVPFFGTVSVAYLPSQKVLGLSKLARIVEIFSRRLQLQERLTREIATAISEAVQPSGVAVVIEATHMCMVMRGVEKPGSKTITSTMMGTFRDDPRTRQEFLHLIRSGGSNNT